MRFFVPGLLGLLASAGATPWGEDRDLPSPDDCPTLMESYGGGPGDVPADCEQNFSDSYSYDTCGCSYHSELAVSCPMGSTTTWQGQVCTGGASYSYTTSGDLMQAAGQLLSVSGVAGQKGEAMELAELLWAIEQVAADAGRDLLPDVGEIVSSVGVDKVVRDVEVDLTDQAHASLLVDGIYVIFGDLDVAGRVEVNGLLLVAGDLTAGELVAQGGTMATFGLGGGMIYALSASADSLEGDDCILYVRDLLTNAEGSLDVAGNASLTGCHGDAGEGLNAGGDVRIDTTTLAARRVVGRTVEIVASRLNRLGELSATSLLVGDSEIEGPGRLSVAVETAATLAGSGLHGDGVEIVVDSLALDATSLIEALPRDEAGLVLPLDPAESGATGLFSEQVPGASFGGYGGTESWLKASAFRPSASPVGDPRDPEGRGVDGWALSWSETTAGGGGGNDVVVLVAGAAQLDGRIEANGGPAPVGILGGGGSGGSGGVIRVEAGTIGGSATLVANGGNGSLQAEGNSTGLGGGGGSGGRIAIFADEADGFAFAYESIGGLGNVYEGVMEGREEEVAWMDYRAHGGPGSTYERVGTAPGRLIIDGNGLEPAGIGCDDGPRCRGVGWLPADLAGDDVILRNATVAVHDLVARSLTLEGAEVVPDDPRLRLTWPLPSVYVEGGMNAAPLHWPAAVYADPLEETLSFTLDTDFSLDAASRVSLASLGGYSRNTPPDVDNAICWNGGSHGGAGGRGYLESQTDLDPEPTFGDPLAPVEVGLGGCGDLAWTPEEHALCGVAGVGGGAFHVRAGGKVRIDGAIDVSGGAGHSETESVWCGANLGNAGGAGGSVWIEAEELAGSGSIAAGGGDGAAILTGQVCGGGGGGGRVAAQIAGDGFDGNVDVAGGAAGCGGAEPGVSGTQSLEVTTPEDTGDSGAADYTGPERRTPADAADDPGCGCAQTSGVAWLPAGVALLLAGRRRARC